MKISLRGSFVIGNEEKNLLHKIKNCSKEELMHIYETIYYDYVKLVSFSVSKYIDDTEHIKDITNDVFLSFFDNAKNINTSIKYYLLNAARNISIKFLIKNNKTKQVEDIDIYSNKVSYKSHASYIELIEDLKAILTSKEVEIIILHAVDGYTFKEISSFINIPHKTVNKIYERAIKKIRKEED